MLESLLFNGIFFIVVYIFVFCVEFFFIAKTKKNKKGKRVDKLITEASYVISKFDLNEKKLDLRKMNLEISLINGFIIAFVSTFVSVVSDNVAIELAIGFLLLMALIYSIYEIYGRCLKKKYGKVDK